MILAGANAAFKHCIHKSSALHNAAHGGHEQLVKDLLQAGACTSMRQGVDEYRRASLHIAAGEGNDGIVSILLRSGAGVDELDAYRNSPLIWGAKGGHLAVVETLLAAGADVSAEGWMEGFLASFALNFAAELGHLDVMEAIIGAGAHVNQDVIRARAHALHCATSRGQVGAIDTLIKAGADTEGLNKQGMTPLLRAAEESGFEEMGALLERGVGPSMPRDAAGTRHLHIVCRYRYRL